VFSDIDRDWRMDLRILEGTGLYEDWGEEEIRNISANQET